MKAAKSLELAGSRGSKYLPKAADGKLRIGEGPLSGTTRNGSARPKPAVQGCHTIPAWEAPSVQIECPDYGEQIETHTASTRP
jgi:hypothetical protein